MAKASTRDFFSNFSTRRLKKQPLLNDDPNDEDVKNMTIMQLATRGRGRPCKKRWVEIDHRIETMMQRFEDSTINLSDYLIGTQLPSIYVDL